MPLPERSASAPACRRAVAPSADWLLALAGTMAVAVAALFAPEPARAAAAQDWPPFVLVAGLLLVGVVADDDGIFAAVGHALARTARSGLALFAGAAALIGVVTALLNLDTSVAFLTPVLVYAARGRGDDEGLLLYGCLLLSNAGSLFLPGSNLTNLIVSGQLHLTGGEFLSRMWAPALAALVVTAAVVAVAERRSLHDGGEQQPAPRPASLGVGLVAVAAATVAVLVTPGPAIPVLAIGVVACGVRLARRTASPTRVANALGLPTLIGLFGAAVALGTLGRVWSGPASLLGRLDGPATAALAAASSLAVNNLPAASLLASRRPDHPFALLVGLDLGPNVFATGSLAWIIWRRSARTAGARPSIGRAARIGAVAAPLSMAAALGALAVMGR